MSIIRIILSLSRIAGYVQGEKISVYQLLGGFDLTVSVRVAHLVGDAGAQSHNRLLR